MKESYPLLSVVTVNYNNAHGLERTARSVRVQSAAHSFEWIIIDGGSTDGSLDVILRYQSAISSWISQPDSGIYNAMNKGVSLARGEYVIFLNSGDEFSSTTSVEEFLNITDYRNYDILVGNTKMISAYGVERDCMAPNITKASDLLRSTLCHQSTFIKRSLFDKEKYDESYMISADMKFNFQKIVMEECKFMSIPVWVSRYDCGGISASRWWKTEEENQRYLKELLPALVYEDLDILIHPKDMITKVISRMPCGGIERKLVCFFVCMLYLPRWIMEKIKLVLR